jgi:hypothetical protein
VKSLPVSVVYTRFTPLRDVKPPDRRWIITQAREIDALLQAYSYKMGNLQIVPNFYVPELNDLLREKEEDSKARGYSAAFRILHPKFDEREIQYIRTQVLVDVKDQIKEAIRMMIHFEKTQSVHTHSNEINGTISKARQLLMLFNLETVFPAETLKISKLMDVLNEKIGDQSIPE